MNNIRVKSNKRGIESEYLVQKLTNSQIYNNAQLGSYFPNGGFVFVNNSQFFDNVEVGIVAQGSDKKIFNNIQSYNNGI